jgi:hypothetical protein
MLFVSLLLFASFWSRRLAQRHHNATVPSSQQFCLALGTPKRSFRVFKLPLHGKVRGKAT